jgi:hypothetical protein
MNDESDRRVEYLDEWDSTLPPEPPRTADRRLLLPFALVVVGAIIVALVLGGAGRGLFGPVAPKLPVVTGPTNNPATPYQPVDVASENAFTPAPPTDDVEAQPLVVTLEQTLPRTADGILSFKVSVCVNATIGSAAGGRVPIMRSFWTLVSRSTNELLAPMATGGPQPVFPDIYYYLKGQCASGYISFQTTSGFIPQFLAYADNRFAWSWRVV